MTYLAAITEWLKPWGPIAWGVIFLVTLIIVAAVIIGGRAISAWAFTKRALGRYSDATLNTQSANPLDQEFIRKRLNLADFYHPHFVVNSKKHFRGCELFGPCQVAIMSHTTLANCNFNDCDVVVVDPSKPLHGAIAFAETEFLNCEFYRVTLLVPATIARMMKGGTGGQMNIISDLACGPI